MSRGNMKNVYRLKDPLLKHVKSLNRTIINRVRLGQVGPVKTNYTIFFLFAGHGLLADGGQAIVLNEFDNRKKFYTLFRAE